MTITHNKLQTVAKSLHTKVDNSIVHPLNRLLNNFLKHHSKSKILSGGGSVLMPQEYFGVTTHNYYAPDKLPDHYDGTVMDIPTETLARPALEINPVPKVGQIGGRPVKLVTEKQVKDAVSKKLSPAETALLRNKGEKFVHEVMKSAAKKSKTGLIHSDHLSEVCKMKKYHKYQ